MAIAHLYLDDDKYKIIHFDFSMHQMTGIYNKPSSRVLGGQYNLVLEANKAVVIQDLILDQRPQKHARIEVLSFDGMKILFKVELANVYVTSICHYYHHQDNHPTRLRCTLTPGIARYFGDNSIIHEMSWNPDNPFLQEDVAPVTLNNEPEIMKYHIEDLDGNEISKNDIDAGEEITLVVESNNAGGETFVFDLDDQNLDYEHNGVKLKNDILRIQITDEVQHIPLKAILKEN